MTAPVSLQSVFAGRRVFLTGHTGFKGAWLALWLTKLGAIVTGYALAPSTEPNLFSLAQIEECLHQHIVADIRALPELTAAIQATQPELVFHLAAQPLVRRSYAAPLETWSTNLMGTVHLLEAVRTCKSVRAVVVVTSDKCYQNRESTQSYREDDALGGNDPYSASKAGAELAIHSYRKSFFDTQGPLLASARAGNVFGGGDWSCDRLIPDAARAIAQHQPLLIRHPTATRPWQHVLEALHGYLLLAARLLAGDKNVAGAFNFGPGADGNLPVAELLSRLQVHWPTLVWQVETSDTALFPEAGLLALDSVKARQLLDWTPCWDLTTGLKKTAEWYHTVTAHPAKARMLTEQQIDQFMNLLR
jgi:CDP-glucose 4,6-dehydratase